MFIIKLTTDYLLLVHLDTWLTWLIPIKQGFHPVLSEKNLDHIKPQIRGTKIN